MADRPFDLATGRPPDALIAALRENVRGAKDLTAMGERVAELIDFLCSTMKTNSAELATFRKEQKDFQQLFATEMKSAVARVEAAVDRFAELMERSNGHT